MSLSQKIEAASEELVSLKDQLVEQEKQLDEAPEDEAVLEAMEELAGKVEKASQKLDVLKRAEDSLAVGAQPLDGSGEIVTQKAGSPAIVGNHIRKGTGDADVLVATAAAALESHIFKTPISECLERYDDRVKAVAGITIKAAQNPAFTNVAGWAQELTRESYGAFMELLQPESIVARLPLNRFDFGGSSKITVPMRAQAATPNLAAAFRAEGAPIRVGAASLTSQELTPRTMGIIGTFSQELFRRSTPNILEAIRKWMIEDTATMLDGHFLSNATRNATDPGGILEGVTTVSSGGATHALITADIRKMVDALSTAQLGRRPVWIMNPSRAWGLSLALTSTGAAAFPEMQNNTLLGMPVVTSVTVPADSVLLVDAAEIAFAGGAPEFLGTDTATIHEEGVAADVAPVVGPGTGAAGAVQVTDVASPVRSLYQTYSSALRTVWELDYKVMRSGAVQALDTVAW